MAERMERLEPRTMMSAVHAVLRPPPFPALVGDHSGVYNLDAMRLVGPGPTANLDEIMADLDVTQQVGGTFKGTLVTDDGSVDLRVVGTVTRAGAVHATLAGRDYAQIYVGTHLLPSPRLFSGTAVGMLGSLRMVVRESGHVFRGAVEIGATIGPNVG